MWAIYAGKTHNGRFFSGFLNDFPTSSDVKCCVREFFWIGWVHNKKLTISKRQAGDF